MSKKEKKRRTSVVYTVMFILVLLVIASSGIAIWFGLDLNAQKLNYEKDITDLHNMLDKLVQYANPSELDPDGKPYVNIQIAKPADATTSDISEILSIVQNQYQQTSNGVSTQITIFAIIISLITIAIPIFNYTFVQKDQVERLNKQYDDFSKDFSDKIEEISTAFNNKIKEINNAFNKEIKRIDNAIDVFTNVSGAVINPEFSKQDITPISDSNNDRARAKYLQGQLLLRQKRYQEALLSINNAIELEANIATYYNIRGVILHEMKHYNEALKDYKKAILLDPKAPNFYRNRGIALMSLKKYEDALKEIEIATKLEPDNNEHKAIIALILSKLNRHVEALKVIESTALINNDYFYRYTAIIKLKIAQIKHEQIPEDVWKDLNKAIELDKENPKNYRYKAEAYLLTQRYDEARQSLDDAFKLDPEEPEIYHLYALYFEAIGDKDKAKEYHELADKYGYIKEPDIE